ncbi:MAG: DHH family phosphoesterase [Paludibacteraceae bacterium]|nr:DHH family phosphoesterase [Paludibacteraceae bacterium]
MNPLTPVISPAQIDAVRQLINEAYQVVVLTHMSPDGDAMGSSLAMRHYLEGLGKRVSVVVPNSFPDFLAWLPKANEHIIYESQRQDADALLEQADLVICTDFNDPKRIGALGEKMLSLSCKKMMIDHHLFPADFPDLTISYPACPSTCELVYRLITCLSPLASNLSPEIATCIYTGMMTDTGNFSFNSNYPEMYQIVGELVAAGVNKDEIYNRVFNAYSADRMRLMGYCLYQKMKIFPEHHTALIYLSRKELYRFNFQSGDAEGIVNLPLQIKDVHYSVFMREDKVNPTELALSGGSKTKIKISLRSQGNRPVNVFAKDVFGGGGHANASGGEYYGPLSEAVQRFKDHYREYFTGEVE